LLFLGCVNFALDRISMGCISKGKWLTWGLITSFIPFGNDRYFTYDFKWLWYRTLTFIEVYGISSKEKVRTIIIREEKIKGKIEKALKTNEEKEK